MRLGIGTPLEIKEWKGRIHEKSHGCIELEPYVLNCS